MLMIVLVHLTGNSALNSNNPLEYTNPNWLFANIIDAICYSSVDCFILISGYFGLRPTIRKFFNLEIPIIMYGLIAFALFKMEDMGGGKTSVISYSNKCLLVLYWICATLIIISSNKCIYRYFNKPGFCKEFSITDYRFCYTAIAYSNKYRRQQRYGFR